MRFHAYSRRELRRARRAWARRNSLMLSLLALGAAGLLGLLTVLFLVPGSPSAFRWYLLGVAQASIVFIFLAMFEAAFLATEPAAIRQMRGAWGEENTRDELRIARRKGYIWGWVDSINLQGGDIDHLIVMRRGGLVAIDSKWRNQVDRTGTADMAREANRLQLRAEALTATLLGRERSGRRRNATRAISVTPLVVLWGAVQESVPDDARVADVEFIGGRQLRKWLKARSGDQVSKEAARDLLARLSAFRQQTWSR